MKRIALLSLSLLSCLLSFSEDFNLYIVDTSGEKVSYAVEDLQRLTFSDGNVVITTTSGETSSVAISGIGEMYFDTETADGLQEVTVRAAQTGETVHIYTSAGVRVSEAKVGEDGSVDLDALPRGVYIIDVSGKGYKVVKP